MPTARCLKCKKEVEIKDPQEITVKGKGDSERKAITGTCPNCGTKVFKFVKKS
jgi:DNA-directed RNA polymerase subunit RPC12/RpoP